MEKKSIREMISLVFKGLTLAMGVVILVLSRMDHLELRSAVTILGIGLVCAGIAFFDCK